VVWCTGWRLDFSWIDAPIFEADGMPRHVRGVVERVPGLYFVGLTFLHSLSSQLILGAPRDSQFVAEALLARSRAPRAAPGAAAAFRAGGSSA
jgi:putative flavoprotein involved in K+ transport